MCGIINTHGQKYIFNSLINRKVTPSDIGVKYAYGAQANLHMWNFGQNGIDCKLVILK